MSEIVLIDYGSGNLHSAFKAIKKAVDNSGKAGVNVKLVQDADSLNTASHIILPGVGAFGDCMSGLKAINGMVDSLNENVISKGKNFLGICVGMQLLAERGLEEGVHEGLGWLYGEVSKLNPEDKSYKIPHMGWNEVVEKRGNPLTESLSGEDFYYVHSYSMKTSEENIIAVSDYAEQIVAAVNKDNIYGTQFHPEKSQKNGLKLLQNFVNL